MKRETNEKARILIVDDEPGARDALEALLFREGYDLAFAASGRGALDRIDKLDPDVILLDVMMPGMGGFQVCELLKSNERWRHIPVILVTALDSTEMLVCGLDAGGDEFLSKPVNGPELRARVRSMLRIKRQYDELKEALRMREDLANMIVHDMRNPLTAILGCSELLRRSVTAPSHLQDIEGIRSQALRLNSYLNDMLMLAKMQANKLILNRTLVDVNHLVLAARETYKGVARSRGIELIADLPRESRRLSLDENLFQRVLDNLISNALKFSPSPSAVTLRVEYPEVSEEAPSPRFLARIQVLDQGPGVPEEHRERIFDRFEAVAFPKRSIPRVGLGLAFCKMVVEAHGGRIHAGANKPRGAVFTVEI